MRGRENMRIKAKFAFGGKKYKIMILGSIFSLLSLIFPAIAGAVYTENGVSVGVKVEVSKDGSSWYCFSGDCTGGQTLTVNPGDSIAIRGYTWNEGETNAAVTYGAIVTNSQYLTMPVEVFGVGQGDIDGNDIGMDSSNYATDANGTATFDVNLLGVNPIPDDYLPTTSGPSDPEIGAIEVTIKDDVPDQTVISLTFELKTASQYGVAQKYPLENPVYAQGLQGGISEARLIISNPSTPTVQTIQTLPQTGRPTQNTPYVPFIVVGFLTVSTLTIKKLAKSHAKK